MLDRVNLERWCRAAQRGVGTEGFALPTVLIAMLLVSAIAVTALRTSSDERMTGRAMREAAKAFYAAEAAVNVVIAAWDQSSIDSSLAIPGDSLDLGWQTLENGCSYRSVVRRVDGGSGRKMYQISATGRGAGGFRSERNLSFLLRETSLLPEKALVVNGNIKINGDSKFFGECGGVHVNGALDLADTLMVSGDVIATDSVVGSGTVLDTLGAPVEPQLGDSTEIPELHPWDYCGEADYILRNGWLITVGSPSDSSVIPSTGQYGWKYNSTSDVYSLNAEKGVPGTVCVNGNVSVSAGADAMESPLQISLLVDGSVQFSGSPVITADHSDGILVMAEGDVVLHGYLEDAGDNYTGLVYSGAQCDFNGAPVLNGQVLCRDEADPPGAINLSDSPKINGEPQITFDCSNIGSLTVARPLGQGGWWQFAN